MKGLAYFIETAKSKALWRFVCRTCYQLAPPQRRDMLDWARYEFERNRNVTDVQQIKYLTAQGTKQVTDMAKSMPKRS